MTKAAVKKEPLLVDAQDRAIARMELTSNVIVEAGAGTGKTTLLIDRIVFLLLGGGVEIGRLVALTFTEKAAAEIKFRLAERLSVLALVLSGQECTDDAVARCLDDLRAKFPRKDAEYLSAAEAAHRGLERAQIGTIHSFCAHLLRLYPLEAGLDPDFRVDADGAAFDEQFELEWALWLDHELGEEAPRPDLWEKVLASASMEDVRALARGLANPRVDLATVGQPGGIPKELSALASRIEAIAEGKPKTKGKILNYLAWAAARLRGENAGVESPTQKPPSWPKAWPSEGREEYKSLMSIAARLNPEADQLLADTVELVRAFVVRLRLDYRRRGWVSFDGLLVGARDLMRDFKRARAETKRTFGAFLIDEFQDTDPLQGELLMYLAEAEGQAAESWQKTKLAAGKLFVVGDAKQSIYRFRGADIAAVEGFTAHLVAQGARRTTLRTNFRSFRAIVDSVNTVFRARMIAKPGLQPEYKDIAHAPAKDGGDAPTWIQIAPAAKTGEVKLGASARRRAEAAWIADWIVHHRGALAYRDVAIVVRTTTDLIAYLEPLKRAGVPYVVEAEKYFYGTQEVSDFLSLLRAIDDPSDRVALAGLLRSPLVAMEDKEIYRLAQKGGLNYQKRVPELSAFYDLLGRFHARAGREPLGDLLRGLLRDTFLVELCARAYHHQQTASNLLKFGRLADEASDRGLTLKEFIADVARSKRERLDEGESPLADENYDAVRILTIHKAKGLEYPAVILPNLSGGTRAAPSEDAVRISWGDGQAGLRLGSTVNTSRVLMDEEERGRQREEDVRVLYVAMTRPKQRLILLGGEKAESGSFAAHLEGASALRSEIIAADGVPNVPKEKRASADKTQRPSPKDFAAAWQTRAERADAADAMRIFSHPSAADGAGAGYTIRDEDDAPAISPVLLGRLCHETLEHWDFAGGVKGLPALINARAEILAREEPQADMVSVRKEASEILKTFLASKAAKRLASVEILGREIPLLYEEGGGAVRGAIDILFRENGKLIVADYKTDRVAAKNQAARAKKYAKQGACYVKAVEDALGEKGVQFEVIFLRNA